MEEKDLRFELILWKWTQILLWILGLVMVFIFWKDVKEQLRWVVSDPGLIFLCLIPFAGIYFKTGSFKAVLKALRIGIQVYFTLLLILFVFFFFVKK